jgi:uncharacterized membrane protein
MANYSKLIAASVGLILLLLHQFFGVDLTAQAAPIVSIIVAILTAVGVWAVPNVPASKS